MRRYSIALLSATLALSTILVAVPAMAETSTVSWDFSTGLALVPGNEVEIAQLTLPDPAGSECTAGVETTKGRSVHPGHNINVYLRGGLLVTLQANDDDPNTTKAGAAGIVSKG